MNIKLNEDWQEEAYDVVLRWAKENASDEDVRDDLGLDEDHEITREDWENYAESCISLENDIYEEAKEDWFDDRRSGEDEEEFLQRSYPYMTDIENNFELTWPYWTNNNEGEADIDSIASEFEEMIGKPVNASQSYHGGRREPGHYVVEPDGSIDTDSSNDAGLEFVSPPMSITEMLSDLDKVIKWASEKGCYTNDSTGLHMNVSVPNLSTSKLDYVKLALLLGDEYVLEQFGRQTNTYTKSAMKIVRDRVRERPEEIGRAHV